MNRFLWLYKVGNASDDYNEIPLLIYLVKKTKFVHFFFSEKKSQRQSQRLKRKKEPTSLLNNSRWIELSRQNWTFLHYFLVGFFFLLSDKLDSLVPALYYTCHLPMTNTHMIRVSFSSLVPRDLHETPAQGPGSTPVQVQPFP